MDHLTKTDSPGAMACPTNGEPLSSRPRPPSCNPPMAESAFFQPEPEHRTLPPTQLGLWDTSHPRQDKHGEPLEPHSALHRRVPDLTSVHDVPLPWVPHSRVVGTLSTSARFLRGSLEFLRQRQHHQSADRSNARRQPPIKNTTVSMLLISGSDIPGLVRG